MTQMRDLPRGRTGGDSEAHPCVDIAPANSNPLAAPIPKNCLRVQLLHIVNSFAKHGRRMPLIPKKQFPSDS
jgi:hypothetical protein